MRQIVNDKCEKFWICFSMDILLDNFIYNLRLFLPKCDSFFLRCSRVQWQKFAIVQILPLMKPTETKLFDFLS